MINKLYFSAILLFVFNSVFAQPVTIMLYNRTSDEVLVRVIFKEGFGQESIHNNEHSVDKDAFKLPAKNRM